MGSPFGPQRSISPCACQKGTGTWASSTLALAPLPCTRWCREQHELRACCSRPFVGPLHVSVWRVQPTDTGKAASGHIEVIMQDRSTSFMPQRLKNQPCLGGGLTGGVGQCSSRVGTGAADSVLWRSQASSGPGVVLSPRLLMSRSKYKFSCREGHAARLQRLILCCEAFAVCRLAMAGHPRAPESPVTSWAFLI